MLVLRKLKCSIIAPTQELSEETKKYFFVNDDKLEVIPNGVEVGSFKNKINAQLITNGLDCLSCKKRDLTIFNNTRTCD